MVGTEQLGQPPTWEEKAAVISLALCSARPILSFPVKS